MHAHNIDRWLIYYTGFFMFRCAKKWLGVVSSWVCQYTLQPSNILIPVTGAISYSGYVLGTYS